MIISKVKENVCQGCGLTHMLREYLGLEGTWYTDHLCKTPEQRLALAIFLEKQDCKVKKEVR